jgi:hypothetical protein
MDEQGLLTFYSIENIAPKGLKPSMKLVKQATAYYEERQVGVQRMYSALGSSHRIDALLRCFNTEINKSWVAIPQDGKQYQIDVAQKVIGKDAIDLTLVYVEKSYEIYTEPTE